MSEKIISVPYSEKLYDPGFSGTLARKVVFFDLMPYIVALDHNGTRFTVARSEWTARALRHFSGLAGDFDTFQKAPEFLTKIRTEYQRPYPYLHARSKAITEPDLPKADSQDTRAWRELTAQHESQYVSSPLRTFGEAESERRIVAVRLYKLTKRLLWLTTRSDADIDPEILELCQRGVEPHRGFDRTRLVLTKDFVAEVASILARRSPYEYTGFREGSDLQAAKRIMNDYAPVAPIMCALGEALNGTDAVSESAPDKFAMNYFCFVDEYEEMYKVLTDSRVFPSHRETTFKADNLYTLDPDLFADRIPTQATVPHGLDGIGRRSAKELVAAVSEAAANRRP